MTVKIYFILNSIAGVLIRSFLKLFNRKEQDELKGEMEKMSELIAELRENCQKLQTELLDSRNNHQQKQELIKPKPRDTSTVGVQVTLLTGG